MKDLKLLMPNSEGHHGSEKSDVAITSHRVRIGIDGRYQGQQLTGVPRYIDELCKQLDLLMPDAEFFLYTAKGDGIRLPSRRWTLRTEPSARLARLKPNIWWKLFAGRLIRQDNLDVFWACAGFIPGGIGKLRTVYTVYDLTFKLYPETMSRTHVWAFRLFFAGDLRRADSVVAISQGTSDRLEQFFGRRADAIVRPDAGPQFYPQSDERRAEVCKRYDLQKPFLLAVSTLEPRKNLLALIDAFLQLKKAGEIPNHELVLIGKKGWRNTAMEQRLADPAASTIRWLGYVPDDDLPPLYSSCVLFCMPSLYEGFGIPLLEASRCGAKTLASNIPEMVEAGGSSGSYFYPLTVNAMKIKILFELSRGVNKIHNKTPSNIGWNNGAKKLSKFLHPNISIT